MFHKNVITGLAAAMLVVGGIHAQAPMDKKQQDVEAIKAMCGCYEVTFQFSETFSPDPDYEKKDDYRSGALEWIALIEDTPDKLSLQHLLIVRDGMIIKHWRQDWHYENRDVFTYNKDFNWRFFSLPKNEVTGKWTQKVYQVDDSPRYTGTASWVHVDGKHYWENRADSPLPRREHTTRNDYNVMVRGNRHEITDYGWLHDQDNDKIIRKDGEDDVLLASEKGYNTYVRVPDEKCKAAQDWWKENKAYWAKVRNKWDAVYSTHKELTLKKTVNDQPLYKYFFEPESETEAYIDGVLEMFVE